MMPQLLDRCAAGSIATKHVHLKWLPLIVVVVVADVVKYVDARDAAVSAAVVGAL